MGALSRGFIAFSTPMIAGNLAQLLAGTATVAMLGRLLGPHALAAGGVIFPISMLCVSFAAGLTNGAGILLARASGSRDEDAAKRIVMEAIALAAIAGALFAFIGIAFGAPILHALGTPAVIFAPALSYLRVVAVSMIVTLPYTMYQALLDGLGDSKTALALLIAATAISLVLMPALMLGLGGLPRAGVLGPPFASLAAVALITAAAAAVLPRVHAEFRLPAAGLRTLVPSARTAWDILRLGTPIAFQFIAVSLSQLAVLSIVTAGGANAVAVYAAMNQLIAYVMTPISVIAAAASAFAAREIAAKGARQLWPVARVTGGTMLAISVPLTVLLYAFAAPLLHLFLTDRSAVELGRQAAEALLWSLPVLGLGGIATALMRAQKFVSVPMAINAVGILPLLLYCVKSLVAAHGIVGVWEAYPIAYVSIAAMEVAYFAAMGRRLQSSPAAAAL